jgi:FkbM family methyltransferase
MTIMSSIRKKIELALISRYIFDNWISLIIKYILLKLGFHTKLIAKIDSCSLKIYPEVWKCLIERFSEGLIKSIKCINGTLYINDVIRGNWNYDKYCNCWYNNVIKIKLKNLYKPSLLIFDCGEYDILDVSNKIVIDVGAFVGDSAIYFALRGARRVIAIEPHPGAYAEMIENIKLNNLENIIQADNVGLASKPSKICVENTDIRNTSTIYHKPGNCNYGNIVQAITLQEVINKFGIDYSNALLKLDCEGCEYDIILNDYDHVKLFNEIFLEYHAYATEISVHLLLKKLSIDYQCKKTGDKRGYIYCIKK